MKKFIIAGVGPYRGVGLKLEGKVVYVQLGGMPARFGMPGDINAPRSTPCSGAHGKEVALETNLAHR